MNATLPDIRPHEEWFRAYVAAERAREQENPAPLDLKEQHTAGVLRHARAIVAEEALGNGACAFSNRKRALQKKRPRYAA